MTDFEAAFASVGGCGVFEMLVFFTISLCSFRMGIQIGTLVLFSHIPSHDTHDSFFNGDNISFGRSSFPFNQTHMTSFSDSNNSHPRENYLFHSIAVEYNLTLHRGWLNSFGTSLYFIGALSFSFIFVCADRFGRRPAMILCSIVDILSVIVICLSNSLPMYFTGRFMSGMSFVYGYLGSVVMQEFSRPSRRPLACNIYWFIYACGYVSSSALAYGIINWRSYSAITGIPCVLVLLALTFVVPESPRWLFVSNRRDEGIDVLMKIARRNRISINPNTLHNIAVQKSFQKFDIKRLFRDYSILSRAVITWFVAWSLSVAYYGISLDAHFASSNIHLSIIFGGIAEMLSAVLAWICNEKLGRRKTIIPGIFVTAALLMLVKHVDKIAIWMKTVVAVLAKTILVMSYNTFGLISIELFPTTHRNTVQCGIAFFGTLGTIVCPFINLLEYQVYYIPTLFYSCFNFLSTFLLIALPETRNVDLPDSIEDAKQIGVNALILCPTDEQKQ